MNTTAVILAAWIENNGPVVVTEEQLRSANPMLLHQQYDSVSHSWTFSVPPGD